MRPGEAERFWSYVIKGPNPDSCWLWVGAVADDGYGRFWVGPGKAARRVVRAQRYAYTAVTGRAVPEGLMVLHRCDVPLCVHADPDPALSHLRAGTGRDNMDDRTRRHRTGTDTFWHPGAGRRDRARRSRLLRDTIRTQGWDEGTIHSILNGTDPTHPTLW
jgi:hypothetical protein